MIFSRFLEHLKQQHWTGVFIELVIVVLGVYIGLQAQQWGKQREDRRSETQIVANLLADLETDRSAYANGMALDVRRINAANASLAGAGLPPLERLEWNMPNNDISNYSFDVSALPVFPADQRDSLWTHVVMGYFPNPSTSAFDAMVGSGDIKLIRDREIVRDIQLYHDTAETVISQNDKLLRLREDIANVGVSYGLAPFAKMPATEYFRLVANTPQLAAAIRTQAMFTMFHHDDIRSADARAAQLQVRLKSYLPAGI